MRYGINALAQERLSVGGRSPTSSLTIRVTKSIKCIALHLENEKSMSDQMHAVRGKIREILQENGLNMLLSLAPLCEMR